MRLRPGPQSINLAITDRRADRRLRPQADAGAACVGTVAAFTGMRAYDIGEVHLDVNVTNPASAALFRGLGFVTVARRARYHYAFDRC